MSQHFAQTCYARSNASLMGLKSGLHKFESSTVTNIQAQRTLTNTTFITMTIIIFTSTTLTSIIIMRGKVQLKSSARGKTWLVQFLLPLVTFKIQHLTFWLGRQRIPLFPFEAHVSITNLFMPQRNYLQLFSKRMLMRGIHEWNYLPVDLRSLSTFQHGL